MGWLVAEMQAQMDDLALENAALEDRLRAALREREAVEAVLDDVEDEHEDALARIHVLDAQVCRTSRPRGVLMLMRTYMTCGVASCHRSLSRPPLLICCSSFSSRR